MSFSWLYDPWVISIITIILTLLAGPLLADIANRFRTLFGEFSGTYLALTIHSLDDILIEVSDGQHIGNRFKGKIDGVCHVSLKDEGLVKVDSNEAKYKFDGSLDERLFVLSYYSTIKGQKSAGTITLQGDSNGQYFEGIWSGFSRDKVTSSWCIWAKLDSNSVKSFDFDALKDKIMEILEWYGIPRYIEKNRKRQNVQFAVDPYFGMPKQPTTSADLFVVMPFSSELEPVYTSHIRKVASELGLSVARADDFFTTRSVMSDIWDAIWASRAVIADCTGRNPNVFYEIGIAHVVGRPVVLITQDSNDVPFDVQHLRYLLYEFSPNGLKALEFALAKTLKTELHLNETH